MSKLGREGPVCLLGTEVEHDGSEAAIAMRSPGAVDEISSIFLFRGVYGLLRGVVGGQMTRTLPATVGDRTSWKLGVRRSDAEDIVGLLSVERSWLFRERVHQMVISNNASPFVCEKT